MGREGQRQGEVVKLGTTIIILGLERRSLHLSYYA